MSAPFSLSETHILRCAFTSWYEPYKSVTIPSVAIPLSDEFVAFLHADGVYVPDRLLPKHAASGVEAEFVDPSDDAEWAEAKAKAAKEKAERKLKRAAARTAKLSAAAVTAAAASTTTATATTTAANGVVAGAAPVLATAATGADGDSDDSDADEPIDPRFDFEKRPFFPELVTAIERALSAFGGSAFAKLNWSSAKDARWITFDKTLRCTTPGEVLLLLKSSAFMAHDLEHAFDDCTVRINPQQPLKRPAKMYLILRKWMPDMHPSREFRCFIVSNRLVGITPRDLSYSPDLVSENTQRVIKTAIATFVVNRVINKFPEPTVVCDVYVDNRNRVTLIGFKPFAPRTNPLLFSYDSPPLGIAQPQPQPKPQTESQLQSQPQAAAPIAAAPIATAAKPNVPTPIADSKSAAATASSKQSADSGAAAASASAARTNARAARPAVDHSDWSCRACTTINAGTLFNCSACAQPKPRPRVAPARGGAAGAARGGGGKKGVFRMAGEPEPTKSDAKSDSKADTKSAPSVVAVPPIASSTAPAAPTATATATAPIASAKPAPDSKSATPTPTPTAAPKPVAASTLIADFVASVDFRVLTSEGQALNPVHMVVSSSGELFRVPSDTVNVSTAAHIERFVETCKTITASATK